MRQTSQQNKFEDAVFKYGNIILKFQPQNTQTFFGHKFKGFYFLPQTLQKGKFEGTDIKYDNGFSKLLPKTPKQGIWFQIKEF